MTNWQWDGPRFRLYRDPARGWLAGVCAGIADYLGIEPLIVRLAFLASLVFFFVPAAIGYIVLALALKPRPPGLFASREEEGAWRQAATAPDETMQTLRRRFGILETRLRALEGAVTARDFELHRKFRDIGG